MLVHAGFQSAGHGRGRDCLHLSSSRAHACACCCSAPPPAYQPTNKRTCALRVMVHVVCLPSAFCTGAGIEVQHDKKRRPTRAGGAGMGTHTGRSCRRCCPQPTQHHARLHLQRVSARLRHHCITELGREQQATAAQAGCRDDLRGRGNQATGGSRGGCGGSAAELHSSCRRPAGLVPSRRCGNLGWFGARAGLGRVLSAAAVGVPLSCGCGAGCRRIATAQSPW